MNSSGSVKLKKEEEQDTSGKVKEALKLKKKEMKLKLKKKKEMEREHRNEVRRRFVGVRERVGRYAAFIRLPVNHASDGGCQIWIGTFDSPELAASAHDRAACKYYGADTTGLNYPHLVDTYMRELSLEKLAAEAVENLATDAAAIAL